MKQRSILSKLKSQVKLIESLITEGDHWPKDYRRKAINRIKLATAGKMPVYTENAIEADVDKMVAKFESLLHKNSNVGYFLPVIRMFIDYVGNDQAKRKEFTDNKMGMLVDTLRLISSDPSLESKFKDDIKNRWSLEDFEKHAAEIQAEINKADADSLASVSSSELADYDVISINSYEELHEKFGGDKTGYKGQSEWCHSNGESTYDSWTDGGTKHFFVLAKRGWENITPPDPKTTNAFDEYGTSLIAILVKVKDCELLNATLRWNHIIEPSKTVPKTSVDKAFLGWGDLSKAVGFNVKAVVEKEIKANLEKVNKVIFDKLKTITEIDIDTISQSDRQLLTHIEIPDNVMNIGDYAFNGCSDLSSVTIPKSVKSIGSSAFADCDSLKNVTIPKSVKQIGGYAFVDCDSLESVTIPNSVTRIGPHVFQDCINLKSITLPDSVLTLGYAAFANCSGLTNVTISNRINYIGNGTFQECSGLTRMTIPDSVKSIGDYAFYGCEGLTHITLGNGLMSIWDRAFAACYSLTSITIPDSVTDIGFRAFGDCFSLTSMTFEGKTIAKVRSMPNYPWGIKNPGKVIRVAAASK